MSYIKLLVSIFILSLIGGSIFVAGTYFIGPKFNKKVDWNLSPVTSAPVSLKLNLSAPDDNLLIFDNNLLVQGQTSTSAVVTASLNDKVQVLDINNKGEFSSTLLLDEGVNKLFLAVFDKEGNSKSEARTIYYSKEKI